MTSNSQAAPKVAVVVGRWQLFHKGHETLINRALAIADKVVVVLGSSFRARDPKNPFTWEERAEMIKAAYGEAQADRLLMLPIRDYFNDTRWNEAVRDGVNKLVPDAKEVQLVGFFKDSSSYYLRNFKDWPLSVVAQEHHVDATELRQVLFGSAREELPFALTVLAPLVSQGVSSYLKAWTRLAEFDRRVAEHQAVEAYKKAHPDSSHVSCLAVVRAGDHVLLAKRSSEIGNGLWQLPAAPVSASEDCLTASIRALVAATHYGGLELSLRDANYAMTLFDHPSRSILGRYFAVAQYFRFGGDHLQEVRPGAGYSDARWIHRDQLASMESDLFEDTMRVLERAFN